jgi:hypothetical protein
MKMKEIYIDLRRKIEIKKIKKINEKWNNIFFGFIIKKSQVMKEIIFL